MTEEQASKPSPAMPVMTPDTAVPGLLGLLPPAWRPYAMLARWDRPVGIWLLFLPCLIGLLFNRLHSGIYVHDFGWALAFLIGAIAMRGAGCTWNDITDRDIDAEVSRTASRPLPAGLVSLKQAYLFTALQVLVGFIIWLILPRDAKWAALFSLPLVIAYPYMKRLTWWPQAWLGMTFNWGVIVGAAVSGIVSFPVIILYSGCILWTIAYDTIYAMQDREDDALIGVRSTARLFGKRAVLFSFCFHMGAAALIALALVINNAGKIGALTALVFFLHGIFQVVRLKSTREQAALEVFKSNVLAGSLVVVGLALAATWPEPKTRTIFADHEIVPDGPGDTLTLPFGLELKRTPNPVAHDLWLAEEIAEGLDKAGIVYERPPVVSETGDATATD